MRVETLVLHSQQPRRLAEFWRDLLGYVVAPNYTSSVQLRDPEGHGPPLLIALGGARSGPGPVHMDLRPNHQAEVVAHALSLGATQVSSQETSWVVLADPDGNRFCVLQASSDYEKWRHETHLPYSESM
ncbi:hypothetical protein SAMN05660748_0097 [Blastococcus aggregatus]|uniref:Glyoxalase-like domain-containing protein n=1 Tax=Blastococcus aggregatus TaxID=38502 RepID=A0A285UWM5_9ACTN|nr:VOC family protein [Blastococcus aggregatus]SOC46193.1 hypothetical protein SAMN05660748_0097 [Blastococcus aggregatus]